MIYEIETGQAVTIVSLKAVRFNAPEGTPKEQRDQHVVATPISSAAQLDEVGSFAVAVLDDGREVRLSKLVDVVVTEEGGKRKETSSFAGVLQAARNLVSGK